jgi:hypothetical protein
MSYDKEQKPSEWTMSFPAVETNGRWMRIAEERFECEVKGGAFVCLERVWRLKWARLLEKSQAFVQKRTGKICKSLDKKSSEGQKPKTTQFQAGHSTQRCFDHLSVEQDQLEESLRSGPAITDQITGAQE